jgi:hypothetical protein
VLNLEMACTRLNLFSLFDDLGNRQRKSQAAKAQWIERSYDGLTKSENSTTRRRNLPVPRRRLGARG